MRGLGNSGYVLPEDKFIAIIVENGEIAHMVRTIGDGIFDGCFIFHRFPQFIYIFCVDEDAACEDGFFHGSGKQSSGNCFCL